MIKVSSIWVSTVFLLITGCTKAPERTVERCFDLPDGVGTLSVQLDTNLNQWGQWKHDSDYKCGAERVHSYGYDTWPMYRDTSYFTPLSDSLFQFTLRYSYYSPQECGDQASIQDDRSAAEERLAQMIQMLHSENPKWMPVAQGVVQIHGINWTFLCTSDSLSLHNDIFEGYSTYAGRNITLIWQRAAPSRAPFNFEAYARRQFATVRFN